MLRICVYLLAMVMALGVANPVAAGASQFDVWLRSGVLRGDTTYTIGGSYSDNQGNRGQYWDPMSETSGTQEQSFYAGESAGYRAEIDQTITSSQTCGSLEVGYSF